MSSDSERMKDYYTKKHQLCSLTREERERKKWTWALGYKNYIRRKEGLPNLATD